ncbi:UDP-N-acetylmuramoyl-L-alanine--D-glutamate ligase [Vagococcus silagei]|uniref:UDP-N-acetylmuramoylalanine--D-glutamate ligase n=1 Tax=Vagococcus silagei TaxID=2508885 RepID=A0A4S3B1D7_9ENTE|nr:UDP-N-acetylmuramoyl-L-alanine--D-glutamate ligase [Vagococcus silagei]THB60851.1 UDP-N-acetylmuramoyl-L-alanine--D-glutamate ligase [Vagococcus silagei]
MKATTKYENKKILVLGLAKSGVAAAQLLHELGAFVTVNDAKKLDDNLEAQQLLEQGMTVITGEHPIDLLDEGFAMIIKNPGIPYSNPILEEAIKRHIPIYTEVELAAEISAADFIGITGTNGKTTTTTMIYQILNANKQAGQALLAGNIGFPACQVAKAAAASDRLVTELSSFQLMGIETFHPKLAIITNLYEAHLDYHGTRDEYVKAKWNIQNNMTADDKLILNFNQAELKELSKLTKATVIPFCTDGSTKEGAYVLDGQLFYQTELIMTASEIGVPGVHNIENALAAICVAKLEGVSNEVIRETLIHFVGVPHRTEFIGQFENRKVYNDSKATNILATERALSGFDKQHLILIAGGLDRGNSFSELVPSLTDLKAIVVMGETKDKLVVAAKEAGIPLIYEVDTMRDAVLNAFLASDLGDSILLSPACASWDQYENFEKRGEDFISEVARHFKKSK